jgi:hypothetical protein
VEGVTGFCVDSMIPMHVATASTLMQYVQW